MTAPRRMAIALCLVAWTTSPARADESKVRLAWARGARTEGCSDGPTIARRISARLGRSAFSDSESRSVEGIIERNGRVWTARIYVHDAGGALAGSREFSSDADDCAPIESAVTLAIALVIDPEADLTPTPPALPLPAPPPTSAPSPAPAATSPCPLQRPCPEPTPAAPDTKRTATTLRGVLAAGLLPSTSAGTSVAADVPLLGALHATVGALFFPEVRTPDRDFSFGLTAAWLGVCAELWRAKSVAVSACGSALLGAIHAVVYVLEPTNPGDEPWAGAALTPKVLVRLAGPLAAELGGDLVFPFTREPFTVRGLPGSVFQESVVGGAGFVGLGLSIP
jgi:hypothetical protein